MRGHPLRPLLCTGGLRVRWDSGSTGGQAVLVACSIASVRVLGTEAGVFRRGMGKGDEAGLAARGRGSRTRIN